MAELVKNKQNINLLKLTASWMQILEFIDQEQIFAIRCNIDESGWFMPAVVLQSTVINTIETRGEIHQMCIS